jgi:micrococcal nuclease
VLRLKLSALFAVAALALDACGDVDLGALTEGDTRGGRVERVVDGDTLVMGDDERVRLIGVDTPETKKPGSPIECFGKAASALTERLVEGRAVQLELDVEERDRYGRLLAYVTRRSDGLDVNAELVRRGYATALTVPPNVRNADRYARLARQARRDGRGLWRACR